MHLQTQEAADWWARPRGASADNWIANYQKSVQSRHRTALVEILQGLQAETLLEVGCHCGPNLIRFGQALPGLRMIGVDINVEAIQAGRQWVQRQGFASRIQLNAGRVPDVLATVPTGSCDVVLSCYALAYIAPPDLDAVLYEMGRIATRAIVVAEPMTGSGSMANSRSLSGYSEWAHDYRKASQWIGTWHGRTSRIVPIVPPVDKLNAILVAEGDAVAS